MGRNNGDFHGVAFSHENRPYDEVTVHAHHPEHGHIGKMELSKFGEVKDVIVADEHQRKGVATGMWNYAKQQGLNPEHSDSRTPAGDAWAASTGDYVPSNNSIYNPDAPQEWD
jgi:hypothetical protein